MRERSFKIQAAAMKIMKTKLRLPFQQLVSEIIETVRTFQAQPKLVKAQIESLIETEYLERSSNDRAIIIYAVSPSLNQPQDRPAA